MSPSQAQRPTELNQAVAANARQPEPVHMRDLQTTQPAALQPMNPQRPHPESEVGLRGGERSRLCPGRFCLCIPCPLPWDVCICTI
ncbi:hypothetical protein VTK56DRAFT_6944 [Thermocarpiscus australiensis]